MRSCFGGGRGRGGVRVEGAGGAQPAAGGRAARARRGCAAASKSRNSAGSTVAGPPRPAHLDLVVRRAGLDVGGRRREGRAVGHLHQQRARRLVGRVHDAGRPLGRRGAAASRAAGAARPHGGAGREEHRGGLGGAVRARARCWAPGPGVGRCRPPGAGSARGASAPGGGRPYALCAPAAFNSRAPRGRWGPGARGGRGGAPSQGRVPLGVVGCWGRVWWGLK
jgi:hypothetical protein